MSKKFLFGLTLGVIAVVASLLWLLSVVAKESFGWFSFGWAVVVLSGGFGIAFVIKGVVEKNSITVKKWSIYLGGGMIALALVTLISELTLSNKLVLPIIAVVLTVSLLLAFVAVGGKKWDQGDNENKGYKNYYERKAEQEAKKEEENK